MRRYLLFVFLSLILVGCESREQYFARVLGVNLKCLYEEWEREGRPGDFTITNYLYMGNTTNQVFCFTNRIYADGVLYNCRFAVRGAKQFDAPGVLVLTDQRVVLWLGDDGKIFVSPDKRWFSSD